MSNCSRCNPTTTCGCSSSTPPRVLRKPSLKFIGDCKYVFDDGTGCTVTLDTNCINGSIKQILTAGSVITFVADNGAQTQVDVCELIADNCPSTLVVNADGSLTYTDNSGNTVFVPAPPVSEIVINNDGTFTFTNGAGQNINVDVCQLILDGECYATVAPAPAAGTDSAGNTYNAGDTVITLANGDTVCIPDKITFTNPDGTPAVDPDTGEICVGPKLEESDGTQTDSNGDPIPAGNKVLGPDANGNYCDLTGSTAVTAPAGGTDDFGNTYNAGDTLVTLADGSVVCIPAKEDEDFVDCGVVDANGDVVGDANGDVNAPVDEAGNPITGLSEDDEVLNVYDADGNYLYTCVLGGGSLPNFVNPDGSSAADANGDICIPEGHLIAENESDCSWEVRDAKTDALVYRIPKRLPLERTSRSTLPLNGQYTSPTDGTNVTFDSIPLSWTIVNPYSCPLVGCLRVNSGQRNISARRSSPNGEVFVPRVVVTGTAIVGSQTTTTWQSDGDLVTHDLWDSRIVLHDFVLQPGTNTFTGAIELRALNASGVTYQFPTTNNAWIQLEFDGATI